MKRIVNATVSGLIALGTVSEPNRDIYEYALLTLLSTGANLIVTIVLGFAFSVPLEMVLMFIPFAMLRATAGGYHANTVYGCLFVSVISLTLTVSLIRYMPLQMMFWITLIVSLLAIIVVFRFAPTGHSNRSLSSVEIHKFRKLSKTLVVSFVVLSLALFGVNYIRGGFSITAGIALSAVATIINVIKKQGGEINAEK